LNHPFLKFLRRGWRLLTDVPGWPNAPRSVRLRRILPIALPCAGLILLFSWKLTVIDPRKRADALAHQPIQALVDDIASLRLDCSDQQAVEMAELADKTSNLALAEAGEMSKVLASIRQLAEDRGWAANLQSSESADEPPAPDAQLAFMQARGRLSSATGHHGSFASLLALLEQLSVAEKRIDLMRLTIRADEKGRYAVEVNFRLARLVTHEKTAE
jgi:hypothetical protein